MEILIVFVLALIAYVLKPQKAPLPADEPEDIEPEDDFDRRRREAILREERLAEQRQSEMLQEQ